MNSFFELNSNPFRSLVGKYPADIVAKHIANELYKKARTDFKTFCQIMFPYTTASVSLEPTFHTDLLMLICQLKAENKLLYDKVVISIPPGHTKTLICNVLYGAWLFGYSPNLRCMLATCSQPEGTTRNQQVRDLIRTKVYKKIFPNVILKGEEKTWLKSNLKGTRMTVTTNISMKTTGPDADLLLVDDPNDTTSTVADLQKTHEWFSAKATRRLRVTNRLLGWLLIQQRCNNEDLTGYVLREYKDVYHLILKAYEENDIEITIPLKDGNNITRTRKAGYLWNSKNPIMQVEIGKCYKQAEHNLTVWQTQYQQTPQLKSGIYLSAEDLIYYEEDPHTLLQQGIIQDVFISCDTASKIKEWNDYSAICVVGTLKESDKIYILNVARVKQTQDVLQDTIMDIYVKYHQYQKERKINHLNLLIEDKSSGEGAINYFNRNGILDRNTGEKIYCHIHRTKPTGTKEDRLTSVLSYFRYKKIMFPRVAEWLRDCENELISFPTGKHDDQTDAIVHALRFIQNRKVIDVSGFKVI